MIVKGINFEDFVNYKKPSMFIAFPNCSFKCDKECGRAVCQNSALATSKGIEYPIEKIIEKYRQNPISKALVCGGLEPFDNWEELQWLIMSFRYRFDDDINFPDQKFNLTVSCKDIECEDESEERRYLSSQDGSGRTVCHDGFYPRLPQSETRSEYTRSKG